MNDRHPLSGASGPGAGAAHLAPDRKVTLRAVLRMHAQHRPDGVAYLCGEQELTWAQYDRASTELAALLRRLELPPRSRVAVLMPDTPEVHVAFLALEKAGHITVGIGAKAGQREIDHLVSSTGACALVSREGHRGPELEMLVDRWRREQPTFRHHVVVDPTGEITTDGEPVRPATVDERRRISDDIGIGPDELFLLNSTSGTTGLPKCVMHHQARWHYFHGLAVDAGELSSADVFLSAVSAPFGFGLWTSHVTPLLLGAPTVLMERFTPSGAISEIDRHGVTVLAAVSTQFVMMLNDPTISSTDLSTLRVLFTGGEAVPREYAARFEERTGALVLQFYGSNETGALSRTTTRDSAEDRLTTAGKVIDAMAVRLLDDDGRDVTSSGGPGQAACRGPAMCLGYYGEAREESSLFAASGWMLTGDIVSIDARGYLSVVGRKADIIIRGGKNISAAAIEAELLTHPEIEMAAAVAMPDPTFGERVCAYVVPVQGADIGLEDLTSHLDARGVTREWWPERLVLVRELPISSGGKVAKGALREDVRARRLAVEGTRQDR